MNWKEQKNKREITNNESDDISLNWKSIENNNEE